MTARPLHRRPYVVWTILAGACACLAACGARSGMLDTPEAELPTRPSTGGGPGVGGAAGTSAATGGSPGTGGATTTTVGTGGTTITTGGSPGTGGVATATGGTGGTTIAIAGTGGTPATGGTGGVRATGGTAGRPPTGGTGGAPATGGAGGGFIGSCEYPSCLWNLIRDCQVVGPCTEDDSGLSGGPTEVAELCCSNGVDERVTLRMEGSRFTGTVAVTKNGDKCYDVVITTRSDGDTVDYAWLSPGGQTVAKSTISMSDSDTPVINCANGESMPMPDECAPDGSQAAEVTIGTCR
jgi:hypothetical protein